MGDLDRMSGWLIFDAAQGFGGTTNAVNGFLDLILDLFGLETGVDVPSLPLSLPAVISAESALS